MVFFVCRLRDPEVFSQMLNFWLRFATDLWRPFSEMKLGVDAVSPIVDPRKDAVADRRADDALRGTGRDKLSSLADVAKDYQVSIVI